MADRAHFRLAEGGGGRRHTGGKRRPGHDLQTSANSGIDEGSRNHCRARSGGGSHEWRRVSHTAAKWRRRWRSSWNVVRRTPPADVASTETRRFTGFQQEMNWCPGESRTPTLRITSALLYQLSYRAPPTGRSPRRDVPDLEGAGLAKRADYIRIRVPPRSKLTVRAAWRGHAATAYPDTPTATQTTCLKHSPADQPPRSPSR